MPYNVFTFLRKLIFIYQSEFYDYQPFLKFAYSKNIFQKVEKRQKVNWTLKVKLLYLFSSFLFSLIFGFMTWKFNDNVFFIKLIFLYFFLCLSLPLIVVASHIFLLPFDFIAKKIIIKKAQIKLKQHKNHLKIMAVVGSYGKTSTKEFLKNIFAEKYSVLAPSGTKNTPLGFAKFINSVSVSTEIIIVEIGAFKKGDIKEMCNIIQPDYGVLTGINEQHLERFGSLENIIQAKNEISSYLPKKATLWANTTSKHVKENVFQYAECQVIEYQQNNLQKIKYTKEGKQLLTLKNGLTIKTEFLGEYFTLMVDLCFKIGQKFNISEKQIIKALEKTKAIKHRLEPKYFSENDVLLIDDSFNGNPDGAMSAIKTLSYFKDKHKIYLTPGLVELGSSSEKIHKKIGESLAQNVDEVWLIQNSVTEFILAGLKKYQFNNIRIFSKDIEAHQACKTDLKPGTALLIQNDWTDNYF